MPDRRLLFPVCAVAITALSACGTGGSPVPQPSTTSSATSTASLPARPKTISVTGLDPCSVLTTDQRRNLGLDRQPVKASASQADKHGNLACMYAKANTDPRYEYLVTPVPQEGAEVSLRGDRGGQVKQVTVAGFGAVETRLSSSTTSCGVVVDVAPGQSLDVQFGLTTTGALTADQICGKAREGAELIMQTLSARG
ncbi:DUF3558 domain-containing protein [Crossiella equi]|uniref:DUF3558 domain-containing protein n=1 Tax=Crossiella equi TaxID=130796 RepID=UPI001AE2120D|nr:DUF3558 domain-containing protein [Crossiella equi]